MSYVPQVDHPGSFGVLTKDLKLDNVYIDKLFKEHPPHIAARILGHNTDNYDNLQLAGRIAISLVKNKLGIDLTSYLDRMKDHLDPKILEFYGDNIGSLQGMLNSREKEGDLNYDWFSANCLLKNYLTKINYDSDDVIETPFQMYLRIAVAMYYNHGDITKERFRDILRQGCEDFEKRYLEDEKEPFLRSLTLVNPENAESTKAFLLEMYKNHQYEKYYNEKGELRNLPETLGLKLALIKETFLDLCNQLYMPASPIIYNSGLIKGQLASCFLISVEDDTDSIVLGGVHTMSIISKNTGAIGLDVSRLRHSRIKNKGSSNGLVPWLYLYNATIRSFNQAGKRKGACTVFCRPHHIDIYEFCEVSLKEGDPYTRAHDLNTAIWFPWLFWERVKNDQTWTLMCPNESKSLNDIYGLEWEKEYILQELEISSGVRNPDGTKKNTRVVKARDLLHHIVKIQQKTGMPYILHADTINFKSNQKNLGYIRGSNLCLEICEYTDSNEVANCNLTSISLKAFVKGRAPINAVTESNLTDFYDFQKLGQITRRVVRNLNKIIDNNCYTMEKIKNSNMKHRPIGIGVSGFAEMLYLLNLPIEKDTGTKEANFVGGTEGEPSVNPIVKRLNKMVFACMYYNALLESVELAKTEGANQGTDQGSYSSFEGSPLSEGKFQFDLWKEEYILLKSLNRIDDKIRKEADDIPIHPSEWKQSETFDLYDRPGETSIIDPSWDYLRTVVKRYGVRNSLLLALMPTATSAQPLRNTETCEMPESNIYSRKVLKGNYPVLNRHLVEDLQEIGLWNTSVLRLMQNNNGSIAKFKKFVIDNWEVYPNFNMENLSRLDHIKSLYKTMWELSPKIFMHLGADRGRYICQSQSQNVYKFSPTDSQLMALHQYGNRLGSKTGMYYLRLGNASEPIKFSGADGPEEPKVPPTQSVISKSLERRQTEMVCNDEVCTSCQ
jgi:ribonucleotide reductase alpha subunit